MAHKRTSVEARDDDLEGLGPEVGPIFNALCDDLSWSQLKWGEYRELFGTSKERVDSLNSVAGFFFGMLQEVLWENILLDLCRLTDQPKVKGRRNLTIRALPELCKDQSLRLEVSDLVKAAVEATEFARDPRNRTIAHHDLELALGGAEPLTEASRERVSAALRAIHKVLNHTSETLLNTTVADEVAPPRTGAVALLLAIGGDLDARR